MPDRTDFFIFTLVAGLVEFQGRARYGRDGSIKIANYFCKIYLVGFSPEDISTALALSASKDTSSLEVEQDALEKLSRDIASVRDIPDKESLLRPFGHMDERVDRIFTFLRKHLRNLTESRYIQML